MSSQPGASAAPMSAVANAIVLLPQPFANVLDSTGRRRWLAGGRAARTPADTTRLQTLCRLLGDEPARCAEAPLRLWGQAGTRPSGWVAAADPVWLRAGMEVVILSVPSPDDIDPAELAELFADLQRELLADSGWRAETVGRCGYLRGDSGMPTALLPPERVDPATPDACRPRIEDAPAVAALTSEIQMFLHDHPINRRREAAGRTPLNDLWLWGGGEAPPVDARALPLLCSDDAVCRGYWHYRDAPRQAWPGSLGACVETAGEHFVAAPGAGDAGAIVEEARSLWEARALRTLALQFDDLAIAFDRGPAAWLRRRNATVMAWPAA